MEAVTDHLPGAGKAPAVHIDGDRRDLRLDACRGLALWFIFIDHIPDNAFDWLTLRNYGFSDTTEVFVFVSGYTCMLAYGGTLREQGWPTIVARALRRGFEIYAAFLMLVIVYLVLIWVAGGGGRSLDETNTRFFFDNPGVALAHVVVLRYTPVNTDILPTFVLLHLAFPAVLWLLIRNAAAALVLSFLLYLMVQLFSWHVPAWPTGELYFNPLAWQILFVFGAWYADRGAGRLKTIVQSRGTLWLAVLYLAFSLIVTLSWQIEPLTWLIPDAVSKLIYPIYKSHLAPVRLVHFLALAVVVSRLMPHGWHGLMKPWMTAMIRCGENSLSMYCFSVLLSFAGFVILTGISGSFAMQAAVSVAGIALMIAAATLMTWEAKLDRRGPKLF
ncbi:OpgC domain-containing protein [Bradyrhizobium sp.]|uniref:OpgC domain-containing protein n=1 Tax=Bradyrhizobium sp. TaxID=376 RepID=UPI003C795943